MLATALRAYRRSRAQAVADAQPAVLETRASSMIMPMLFRGLAPADGLSVLDFGAASSAKVAYFSDRKCRIEFVDLLSELEPCLLEDATAPEAFIAKLETLLVSERPHSLDLVLFWDVLNYLPEFAVAALQQCLQPQLHSDSRAHCFGVRHADTPIPWSEHAFEPGDQILSRAKSSTPWTATPHTPSALNRALTGLEVDRAILLQEGRLELLLTPHSL